MQPTTQEMQAMAAAGQISLDDLRNGHVGAANGAGAGVHDDFLDQMFGSLPPSAWHDLAAGTKHEDGAQADGMQQQQLFGGPYDDSVMLASRLRQHQISGGPGGGAAAAKQMVLQQLADLRQGHHNNMLLQGMGRSPSIGGGGGDGGLLLPLTLGNGGSGGDVQALLKAAANSAGGDAGVFGGFAGSLQQQQHFQPHPQVCPANGAHAEPDLWRSRRCSRRRGATTTTSWGRRRQWRAGAAEAAGARAARPGHRPTQHRGATSPGEDRREDEGPARTGAQRQQDGQGVDAGRDHRLRQVPAAPSQGAEHEPAGWRRCRRAARGRHVLGGAGRRSQRRCGRERRPDGDGAAGGQADGGGHGRRHAVPAGEGPVPHARLPRLRHLLRHLPAPPSGRRGRRPLHRRAAHERRHAHGRRRRRRAGIAEHVRADGAVGDGQRRRVRQRRRGLASQGRRVRLQAVSPQRPPRQHTNGGRNPRRHHA